MSNKESLGNEDVATPHHTDNQDHSVADTRDFIEAESQGDDNTFDEGFTAKTIIGSIFVSLIMTAGAIYLGLVAGSGLGAAAQWVTIVLFAEIARRSFLPLKRQEIFLLYYVAGGLAAVAGADRGISGGPFGWLIWNQYFIQSPQAAAIAKEIPWFSTPQPGSAGLDQRNFFHPDWWMVGGVLGPIPVMMIHQTLERLSWLPAGYLLFRATSDVERLPFPLASVAASGATALAEAGSKEDSWRWRIFSTGTVIGLIFGAVYVAIPIMTATAFGKAVTLIPIPFIDFMASTETILPAAPVGYSGDLGKILTGFVLPFEMVAATCISSLVFQVGLNPVLYKQGILHQWHPGTESIETRMVNNFDFWLSAGIGIQLAIAVIGIYIIVKGSIEASRGLKRSSRGAWHEVPAGRGDKAGWWKIALGIWLLATLAYIAFTHFLIPQFPITLLLGYGLLLTPLNSYVAARMFGLTSQDAQFPYVKELTVMESGYKRIDVWFAPMPIHDYGSLAQRFREVELTKTKFTSILKAELLMFPLIMLGGFIYWSFIWGTSQIPSSQYPFAQRMWPLIASNQAIWNQINKAGGATWVLDSIKPSFIIGGGVVTLALYGVMFMAKLPMLAFYGAAGGANALPADTVPLFVGACLGKFYFAKRYGVEKWRNYAPVLLAGFACGTGLISMAAIALALIAKAVQPLPF
ncbi:hypothetical protein [Armatimonas sp.]|uniref:hypothetical protein n=1 Tax=Armatimonas sp. TaxID=1872638 RepID=UPI00286CE112|nr:hypothetical protein [Armatimonas sp.]